MNKAIIHISDLHVSLFENLKGNEKIVKSFFTTNSDKSLNTNYVKEFVKKIKKDYVDFDLYLLISGDLTDTGEEEEFIETKVILNDILGSLNIDKSKVLIVPGDHDVFRKDCEDALRLAKKNGEKLKEANEYHIEKLKNFKNFYDEFYSSEGLVFDPEKVVVSKIFLEDENIVLVGLNSNYKIDFEGGLGFFVPTLLKAELNKIKEEYNDASIVTIFHHNIFASYEDKMTGQWFDDDSNRLSVLNCFSELGINVLLYGNEHTRTTGYSSNHSMTYSDCGAFTNSQFDPQPSFKIYIVNKAESELSLNNNLYLLIKSGNRDVEYPFGNWAKQNISEIACESEKIIIWKKNIEPVKSDDILSSKVSSINAPHKIEEEKKIRLENFKKNPINYKTFDVNNAKHVELLKIIKKENLFHSGHFHWSETSRAHGWIDVSKLFSNKEYLNKCKKYIFETLVKSNVEYDFIIGLGVEGNILATRTAILSSKPYSFLPYSYRYDDHSKFEKLLNFDNNGKFKTILIITDVVHDGRTIRKLIHKKREEDTTSEFFVGVEKIIVVSLFYTGELPDSKDIYYDIINKHKEGEGFDSENDHLEDRIEFHFVSHIRVEVCPYNKNNYKTDCIIVREGLGCVHKFYTEK